MVERYIEETDAGLNPYSNGTMYLIGKTNVNVNQTPSVS